MANVPPNRRGLIHHPASDLSETSTAIASPSTPATHHRHTYQRMPSQGSVDFADLPLQNLAPLVSPSNADHRARDNQNGGQGLGISREGGISRVPVGSRASLTPPTPSKRFFSTPTTGSPLSPLAPGSSRLSTPWMRHEERAYTYRSVGGEAQDGNSSQPDVSQARTNPSRESLNVSFADGEEQSVMKGSIGGTDENSRLLDGCPAKHDIHSSSASWLSISILSLSIYSTIFSGIWLVLAIAQPRYGRTIHSGGALKPPTASVLFALLAKTIELSFVTVFVTFLGQVLSRRSLVKSSRGITIAELTMRTWVIQPGFMITHWHHLQHASLTVLGAITLTATIVAMFYTTASDALVSPHLRYGKWENKLLYGLVQASYANPQFIEENCPTPISTLVDPEYKGLTCLGLEHAGQAYHNTMIFLDTWTKISEEGEGISSEISQRPQAIGMLFDNTTVTGSWVATNTSNMTAAYKKYNRIINNVTMAMPHAGLFSAARNAKNGILQPEDLEGLGEYSVRASVVSPTINVLCVNVNETELAPLIYVKWPNARTTNSTTYPGQVIATDDYFNDIQIEPGNTYLNSTVFDDIFLWGAAHPDEVRQPPIFPMYPIDYNSITNISVHNSDSNYLLIKSHSSLDYTLCQIRSFLSPFCSTQYNVSGTTGGHLQSHCEDPSDPIAYAKSVLDHPVSWSRDWRNVGSQWITSLSLNTGITNANASTSRLLSQLVCTLPDWGAVKLPPLMPSIAEMLAVMVGNTLLLSTTSSTFYHFWNYTATVLDPGVYQAFNASLSTQQYASGATQRWQAVFYLVLLLVFGTNLFCLLYFLLRSGLVTDYTETQNLFALAVNSPPSRRLGGSCGAGPEGEQLGVDWHVEREDGSGHFFIREGVEGEGTERGGVRRRRRRERERERRELRSVSSYSKLSGKRTSWL